VSILITAANSAQAHKLKSKLNTTGIILGDYRELPAFMLKQGEMMRLPDPRSIAYTHEMLTLCLDNAIDTIYVLTNEEAALLLESRQLFKEYNIELQVAINEI
jgi:hypothetical protein